ncbi:peptide-methionine (S)-S-oxide reductase MsrA [Pedobacter namyangjuensis]|uniref:peptide-methionine (S)-S-oxide reductase MsrA n=1 Tax=Pedobacter namyangjuensis TaxID=600626 RepID=UPI000DE1E26C|nr:peptide-methionine (S)-S-oxide reductase MsrA [Pedobacter namyangjuensis]
MKRILILLLSLTIATSCSSNEKTKADLPTPGPKQKVAVFAAGCFWGIQEGFSQLKGVVKATSGYTGGTTKNPTYEQVNTDETGHAEAVQVIYDPSVISFAQLLEAFFVMHDPTQLNRQGPDVGTSYRSMAFYSDDAEKKQIETVIKRLNSKSLAGLVVTEVKPIATFYPAEKYHQNYYRLNPNNSYIVNVCGPKVQKLRKAFPELIQEKYK